MSVPANLPRWYDGWDALAQDHPTEDLKAGTRFRLTRTMGRRTTTAHCEMQTRSDPLTLAWIELIEGALPVGVTFHLRPAGPATTELAYTREFLV